MINISNINNKLIRLWTYQLFNWN